MRPHREQPYELRCRTIGRGHARHRPSQSAVHCATGADARSRRPAWPHQARSSVHPAPGYRARRARLVPAQRAAAARLSAGADSWPERVACRAARHPVALSLNRPTISDLILVPRGFRPADSTSVMRQAASDGASCRSRKSGGSGAHVPPDADDPAVGPNVHGPKRWRCAGDIRTMAKSSSAADVTMTKNAAVKPEPAPIRPSSERMSRQPAGMAERELRGENCASHLQQLLIRPMGIWVREIRSQSASRA